MHVVWLILPQHFFRSYFSDRIFEFAGEIDFFKMLHFVILVVLLNRLVITKLLNLSGFGRETGCDR